MKSTFTLTFLLFVLLYQNAYAANESGSGGGAIVCREDAQITRSVSYDLWRGENDGVVVEDETYYLDIKRHNSESAQRQAYRAIERFAQFNSELAKPFKLGGTLASPSLVIDSRQAVKTIGKAAGGVMLFGPIGIAAALLSGSSDEEDLCVAASEAAKRGVKLSASKESKGGDGSTRRTTEGEKEKGKGIGSKLKQLFGR